MVAKKALKFAETTATSWQDLMRFAETGVRGFVYRGQSDADWPLATSIERGVQRFNTLGGIEIAERWMLDEFKSKYNLYGSDSPADDDAFAWLALLQHHGGPTRLLDFTLSPYVAAHFALSNTTKNAAIWALNHWAIRDALRGKLEIPYAKGVALKDEVNRHHIALFNKCVPARDSAAITYAHLVPLVPIKASLRVSRQQGMFMAPTTLRQTGRKFSFSDSLLSSFGADLAAPLAFTPIEINEFVNSPWPADEFACVKLIIPENMQKNALGHLTMMGLTEEGLFPDLDGLARSLILKHIRK